MWEKEGAVPRLNSLPCPTKADAFAGTRVPPGLKNPGLHPGFGGGGRSSSQSLIDKKKPRPKGRGQGGSEVPRLNSLPCPTKADAFAGARVPPGLKNPGLHPGFGGGGSEFYSSLAVGTAHKHFGQSPKSWLRADSLRPKRVK